MESGRAEGRIRVVVSPILPDRHRRVKRSEIGAAQEPRPISHLVSGLVAKIEYSSDQFPFYSGSI